MALLVYTIHVVRRIIFVASALYLSEDYLFVKMGIFMISSYLKILYIASVKPFESNVMVVTEAINEMSVLLFGYLAFMLVDQSLSREQILRIGEIMAQIMYLTLAVNIIFLVISFLIDMRQKLNAYAYRKVLKSSKVSRFIQKIQKQSQD